jgi:hypothetical protein
MAGFSRGKKKSEAYRVQEMKPNRDMIRDYNRYEEPTKRGNTTVEVSSSFVVAVASVDCRVKNGTVETKGNNSGFVALNS